MPGTISMVYPIEKGSIKKEIVYEIRTTPSLSLKNLRAQFVDVVANDVVINNQIYGLPLSVDTLAMFYRRIYLIIRELLTHQPIGIKLFKKLLKN